MDLLIKKKGGFFSKIKDFFISRPITDEVYEELEEMLIQSDISFNMTLKIVEELEKEVKKQGIKDTDKMYNLLREIMINKLEIFEENEKFLLDANTNNPKIVFIVGVNGVGKTTTIAKLSNYLKNENKKVLVAAADTFRAAAVEQIKMWTDKIGVDLVEKGQNSDPASVVYEAMEKLNENKYDVLIIDTAGRLQNKINLMKELEKMYKIISNFNKNIDVESLLVIDSTTGQNAIEQAKVFNEVTNLTGIILTKFDGSAKGGVVFSVVDLLKKPIRFVGIGEKVEDIKIFNSKEFVKEIFDTE